MKSICLSGMLLLTLSLGVVGVSSRVSSSTLGGDWEVLLIEHSVDLSQAAAVEVAGMEWLRVDTGHFVVYYTDETKASLVRAVASHAESIWEFLRRRSRIELPPPVRIYLAPDRGTYEKLLVSGLHMDPSIVRYASNASADTSNAIFINAGWGRPYEHIGLISVLVHEATHVFSFSMVEDPLSVSWWGGECMSQYLDMRTYTVFGVPTDTREEFHDRFEAWEPPTWKQIVGLYSIITSRGVGGYEADFLAIAVRSIYAFLEDTYGPKRFKEFWWNVARERTLEYSDLEDVLQDVYGTSLEVLEQQWRAYYADLSFEVTPIPERDFLQHDLMVDSLLFPGERIEGLSPIQPMAVIRNLGATQERDILITLHIRSGTDELYSEMQMVGMIEASDSLEVLFSSWTPSEEGRYHFEVWIGAPEDENPGNNVTSRTVDVLTLHPFTDVSPATGIRDAPGSAVALGDYDADGYMDVYMVVPGGANVLYRNNKDGTFSDVTSVAGVGEEGTGQDAAFLDYDNDGHLDLYVVNGGAPSPFDLPGRTNVLYHNNGDGSFTEVSSSAGVDHRGFDQGVAVGDYDRDGYVDLYVVVSQAPNVLYRNKGDGTFEEVTVSAGVGDAGDGRDAVFFDYDGDGLIDLYVVNDGRNALYHNNGDGTFENVARSNFLADVGDEGEGWNAVVGDYDNDGDLDVYVGNVPFTQSIFTDPSLSRFAGQDRNGLYRNNGDGTFTEVSFTAGVDVFRRYFENMGRVANVSRRGVAFGDYDNDGDLDVYVSVGARAYGYEWPSFLYRNNGDGTFSDATSFDANGQASVFFDYDRDGDLDVLIRDGSAPEKLYRNDGEPRHWVEVKGMGTQSNRDGIGAKVRVVARDLVQLREIHSESGLVAHFGLGERSRMDTLEVIWPSGLRDVFTDLPADQRLTIKEGSAATFVQTAGVDPRPGTFVLFQNVPNPFNPSTLIVYQLPRPAYAELSIYNLLGQRIRRLVHGHQEPGRYEVRWDGRDDQGREMASGIYWYRLQAGKFTDTKQALLLR